MYKNILVPIAFDEDHKPEQALKVARSLAEPGARITLLHVLADVPAYAISYMPPGYKEELRVTIQAAMDKYAAEFENGKALIRSGNAPNEILSEAEEAKSDCIIIASHRPGFGDYLIGSTAARVVRHAHCSVVVLR